MFKYQIRMLNNYNRTPETIDSLSKVYGRFSDKKARAEETIKEEMQENGGFGFRITSHSSNFFTCAYKYDAINSETGEYIETRLVYHTPTNRYEFAI